MQGVGFRPYVHRLAGELGLAGFVLNDERGVLIEVEGAAAALSTTSSERLPLEAPPLARVERVRDDRARADRRGRVRDQGEPPRRRGRRPRVRRRRHLRRLPARAVRPRRPPPPLPVRELHQLRPALHDRARRALRPAAHDDGGLPHVRALPRRVRGPVRPALPRPAERVPRLRAAAAARRARDRRRGARGAAVDALRGRLDRRGQGAGRVPPGLPRRPGAGRGGAALAQAPRGPAVRPDGAVAGGGARAGGALAPPTSGCSRAASGRS